MFYNLNGKNWSGNNSQVFWKDSETERKFPSRFFFFLMIETPEKFAKGTIGMENPIIKMHFIAAETKICALEIRHISASQCSSIHRGPPLKVNDS